MARVSYRDTALEALSSGADATAAIEACTGPDDERDHRQLGVVGRDSQATWTAWSRSNRTECAPYVRRGEEMSASTATMLPLRIPVLESIPFLGPILFSLRPLTYMAFIAVPLVWFLLFRTKWCLRVRSVGEHPHAADTVGINVVWTKASAVLLGGLFAGLGCSYFTIGSVGAFQDNNPTAGYGFIALAAVIMGRWHPVLGALVALFFGFCRALAQTTKLMALPIPGDFIEMLPYLATIIAVAGLVGRVRAPAADGAHFVKTH